MNLTLRLFAATAATAVTLMAVLLIQPAAAQNVSPIERTEIEKIIREYLLAHPEVLQEAFIELEKRQVVAEAAKHRAAIQSNAQALFNSSRQVVLGNPQGDVTMVEFFDYNCGFCKRALADMLELLKTDTKLKVVLKEFPVLGEASIDAARVSIAVRMQDKTGKKYLDFHQKLFERRGQIDRAQALAAAKEAGLDMSRLEKDMVSDEIKATLEESFKLADALGMSGTPTYVVGSEILVGAVGLAALKEKINAARCGRTVC
jgi:protein-disulfide isomerase